MIPDIEYRISNTSVYSTNRINALGLKGPEQTPKTIKQFLKLPTKHIEVDNNNIQESEQILYKKAYEIFAKQVNRISNPKSQIPKNPTVFLGGDHSITYPIFRAFQKQYKKPFLIIFDAHPDCMPPSQEPTHEEFLRAIIENGFPSKKIILIGIRKIEPEEKEFLNKHKVKTLQNIRQILALCKNHDLYISIDIDVLDPLYAPAINYPEPNGLSQNEFFKILNRLLKTKNLKALDIVEAIPKKDKNFNYQTLKTIAKIVKRAIGLS